MSDEQPTNSSSDSLQFNTVEPAIPANATAPNTLACVLCRKPISQQYFAISDKPLCSDCYQRVIAPPTGTKLGRVTKAGFLGLGAGLLGALVWFVVRRVAHVEVGFIAILVGFMVGSAVRKGSGGRGGRAYQILAVLITYCCIAANYMPDVIEAAFDVARKHRAAQAAQQAPVAGPPEQAAGGVDAGKRDEPKEKISFGEFAFALVKFFVFVFGICLAAPFLGGAQNLIGLLIIGFALWEAWRRNAIRPLPLSGPYQVGPQPTA